MMRASEFDSNRSKNVNPFLEKSTDEHGSISDPFLSVKNWLHFEGRDILNHEAVFCGKGTRHAFGFVVDVMLGTGLPEPYINRIARGASINCPAMENWFLLRIPIYINVHQDIKDNDFRNTQKLLLNHDLENIAVFGSVEDHAPFMTFTALYGISEDWNAHTIAKLQTISSCVHEKLMNCSSINHNMTGLSALSEAELKIMEWLRRDKSNWEIAQILGKSEGTVKNQVKKIFLKLGINKRGSVHQYFAPTTVQLFS